MACSRIFPYFIVSSILIWYVNHRIEAKLQNNIFSDSSERISIEDGIFIEHKGNIHMASEASPTTMISILIKLPNMWQDFTIPSDKFGYCRMKSISPDIKAFVAYRSKLDKENENFIAQRKALLNNYISKRRGKRQILALLGGALLGGGIATGLSQVQLAQIRQHISENGQEIFEIRNKLENLRKRTALLGENTIALVKEVRGELLSTTESLECEIYWLETINQLQLGMIANHNSFDNILWTAISGNNNMLLTPRSIDPIALSQIVNNMTLFEDLIYKDDHNLLYNTASLTLVEISHNLTTAHFILTFPTIHKTSRTLTLYKTHQVGIFTPPEQCTYRNMPDHVAHDGNYFWSFRTDSCVRHNNIYLCNPEAVDDSQSCVQLNNMTCSFRFTRCTVKLSEKRYISSLAGLLIRNNIKDTTFIRYTNKSIVPVDLTRHYTAFVNWTNISEVHLHNVRIVSPDLIGKPISIINYIGNNKVPYNFLDNSTITGTFNAISNKFNKSIDELLIPMFDHWQYSDHNNGFKTNSHALIATITVTSVWLLALSCYTCRKTPCLRVCYSCGTCIIKPCLCKERRHRGKQKVFFRRLERKRRNLGSITINDPTNNQDHTLSDQYITRSI